MLAVAIFLLFFFFSRYGDHRDLHSFPTRRSSDLSEVSFECLRSFRVLGICQSVAVRMIVNPACSSADRHTRCVMNADRKSTRLNSSHRTISYAVFCLKKKKKKNIEKHKNKTIIQD